MIKYGRALYYPSIEFRNLSWFKLSTLFYEGLDRIVPKNIEVYDHDEIRQVNDEIDYIKDIDPKSYANQASDKYLDYLKNNILILDDKKLNKVVSRDDENQFSVHHDKIGHKLIHEIKDLVNIKEDHEWYSFSPVLGLTYMAFLANEIGNDKNLPVITDYEQNQVALNTTQIETSNINEDISFNLASLTIKSYLPRNINHVSVGQLIEFRKKHEPERIRFYSNINDLVKDLNEITDKNTVNDILNFRKKEIDGSVDALRLSLKGLGIEVYEGLLGISIPSALQLLPNEDEFSSLIKNVGSASILLALGAKSYINMRKIKNDSPYSYLISLEKSNLGREALLKNLIKGKILI